MWRIGYVGWCKKLALAEEPIQGGCSVGLGHSLNF